MRWNRGADPPEQRADDVSVEMVYTGLLIVVFLIIGWFAAYVVYKLYHGQR